MYGTKRSEGIFSGNMKPMSLAMTRLRFSRASLIVTAPCRSAAGVVAVSVPVATGDSSPASPPAGPDAGAVAGTGSGSGSGAGSGFYIKV